MGLLRATQNQPGSLQNFMGQLGQRPQGGGFTPNYIRPPMSNTFQAPSHLAANDYGGIDPSALKYPTGHGPLPGDEVMGYGDVMMNPSYGVNFYRPEGYGIFRSNSFQGGYPTWQNAGSQQPIADAIGGFINPFGGIGGGGGGGPTGGGDSPRDGSGDPTLIKRTKS